jgi:hypothetical protein
VQVNPERIRFNEVASVFMRLDHVASGIVNADHGIVRASDCWKPSFQKKC